MKYAVIIRWNKTVVLDGKCSASVLWEILRMFAANYSNSAKAAIDLPTLVDLANAERGAIFTGWFEDGTGHFSYSATCIRETAK